MRTTLNGIYSNGLRLISFAFDTTHPLAPQRLFGHSRGMENALAIVADDFEWYGKYLMFRGIKIGMVERDKAIAEDDYHSWRWRLCLGKWLSDHSEQEAKTALMNDATAWLTS